MLRLQVVIKGIGSGVLECWSTGLIKEDIKPSANTPTPHCSNTPILKKLIAPLWITVKRVDNDRCFLYRVDA